jgi:hypothetical protein
VRSGNLASNQEKYLYERRKMEGVWDRMARGTRRLVALS